MKCKDAYRYKKDRDDLYCQRVLNNGRVCGVKTTSCCSKCHKPICRKCFPVHSNLGLHYRQTYLVKKNRMVVNGVSE